METHRIPAQNLAELRGRVALLNKRAAKLGVAPLELREGAVFTDDETGKRYANVELIGERIGLPGWTFLGTVEHHEPENILRSAPGETIPETYRTARAWCEHCQTRRQRRDSYIVRHDDGRTVQLGRDCTRDYLGHIDPQQLARMLTMIADLEDEEPGEHWGRSRPVFRPVEVVELAVAAVRTQGSYHAASMGAQSTASLVRIVLYGPTRHEREMLDRIGWSLTDADRAEAEHLLSWIATTTEAGYLADLRAASGLEYIEDRHVGLLASLPKAAQTSAEREREQRERDEARAKRDAERAALPPAPEGRQTVEGEVIKVDSRDTGFDVRYVMTVRTDAGWLAWGTIPASLGAICTGDRVRFTATLTRSDSDHAFAFYKRPTKAAAL